VEFAELDRFCLDPDGPPYAWWQSSFVLSPPEQVTAGNVRVVSFFITARLAPKDTRGAVTEMLVEQQAELLGQPQPDGKINRLSAGSSGRG
jgi:hypothetical protein